MQIHTENIGALGVGRPPKSREELAFGKITQYSQDPSHLSYVSVLAPNVVNVCGWPLTLFVALVHVGLWIAAIVHAGMTIDAVEDMNATFNVKKLSASAVDQEAFKEVFRALDNTVEFSKIFTVLLLLLQVSVLCSVALFEVVVWILYYGRSKVDPDNRLDNVYNVCVLILCVSQVSIACVVYTVMMLNMAEKHDIFARGLSISIVLFFMPSFIYRYNNVWLHSDDEWWKRTRVEPSSSTTENLAMLSKSLDEPITLGSSRRL